MALVRTKCPHCSCDIEYDDANISVVCGYCSRPIVINKPQTDNHRVYVENGFQLLKERRYDDAYAETEKALQINDVDSDIYAIRTRVDLYKINELDIDKETREGIGNFFNYAYNLKIDYNKYLQLFSLEEHIENTLAHEKGSAEDKIRIYDKFIGTYNKVTEVNNILTNYLNNIDDISKRDLYQELFNEDIDPEIFSKAIVTAELKIKNRETEDIIIDLKLRVASLDEFKTRLTNAIEKVNVKIARREEEKNQKQEQKNIREKARNFRKSLLRGEIDPTLYKVGNWKQHMKTAILEVILFATIVFVLGVVLSRLLILGEEGEPIYYETRTMFVCAIISWFITMIINISREHKLNVKNLIIVNGIITYVLCFIFVLITDMLISSLTFSQILTKLLIGLFSNLLPGIISAILGLIAIIPISLLGKALVNKSVIEKVRETNQSV